MTDWTSPSVAVCFMTIIILSAFLVTP